MSQLLQQAEAVEDMTIPLLKQVVLDIQPEDDEDEVALDIGHVFIRMVRLSLATYAIVSGNSTAKIMEQPMRDAGGENERYLADLAYSQQFAKLMALIRKHKPSIVDAIRRRK